MDAIVFDWDGTLVDTLPAILEANAEVLREHGVAFDLGRYRETYAPDWRVMYLRLGIPEGAVERAGARWLELYSATAAVGPFAGVVEALQRLAAAGFAMGLVTAGHRALVQLQLERFGLGGLLPVRVCGDDDVAAKPHPAPLLRALAELGIAQPAGHSTYVGDAPDDMRMAAAVGARGVGITSILATADDLREAGADEVHASVLDWVAAFLSSSAPPRTSCRPGRVAEPSGDSSPESGRLHAIVLADGTAPTRAELTRTWPGWDTGIGLVVAADGGARLAIQLGLVIDRWVGDGDSLDAPAIQRLSQSGVSTALFATDKDESDTELAVLEAVAAGAAFITILGALGGVRLDHTLANIALLAHPALAGRTAHLLDAATRITLLTGNPAGPETTFEGRIGDTVSLLPLDAAVRGVRTTGLRYPLDDESLELGPARGLSNVRTAESATIAVRSGRLLVVESPATLTP